MGSDDGRISSPDVVAGKVVSFRHHDLEPLPGQQAGRRGTEPGHHR